MQSGLAAQPQYQALLALRLSDGSAAFIANVGHGGFGDGGYLPMGPQPVVKRFPDGGRLRRHARIPVPAVPMRWALRFPAGGDDAG
jgi:hypothetical protein